MTFQQQLVVLSPAPSLAHAPAPSSAPVLCEFQPAYVLAVPPLQPSFWPVTPAAASLPPKVKKKKRKINLLEK